jgi:ribonucleoside-diphosphate reductase alpha chain
LLNTYKFGWKTSYYQNTYDYKTDDSHDDKEVAPLSALPVETLSGDADCDACAI